MLPVVEPMLATLASVDALTRPAEWRYEVKFDGYRCVAYVEDGRLTLRSRGGLTLTHSYPEIGEIVEAVSGQDCILDGEIVSLLPDGRSSFNLLQNHGNAGGAAAHFMAFDLLHLGGQPLLAVPYLDRRSLLETLVDDTDFVHVPSTFDDDLELALALTKQQGMEGIIAKKAHSAYEPGARTRSWLKVKHLKSQDVVVIGWTPGNGRRSNGMGAVLTAIWTPDGLAYAGRVGSGFTDADLDDVLVRLTPLIAERPAVTGIPTADARGATWVRPELVAEISHSEWSSGHRLRHPVWKGWRPDKSPTDCVREG